MKKVLMLLGIIAFSVSLFGCETTEGFGRDVENAGDSIEEAAEEADNE